MCDGPYKSRKSNRKKHTRGLKFDFSKEVPWRFNRRPQRAIQRIGASDPPLYSCKNLRVVWKRPNRRFFLFNPDFTSKRSSPLKSWPESTPFPGKNFSQKSPLKVRNQSKSPPPSVLLRQAPGLRIRKRGSVAGPGIKIRANVARIRVPSSYPAKDGRIRTPVFSLSLTFL